MAQIYLLSNALLDEPLADEHVKQRLLGHWGTCPGMNLVYAHMNRVINERGLDAIFLAGTGHGGPAMMANTWLEGSFSERYPDAPLNRAGMERLVHDFSFPGGMSSHVSAEVPGSINEGGELGYVLTHAYGAVFDDPDLVAVAIVGDGEAETAALAASWHSHRFIRPEHDGAVLPVLHLNGWKIANPTLLARLPDSQLQSFFEGLGHHPLFVEGDDPTDVHLQMAAALDESFERIEEIQTRARNRSRVDSDSGADDQDRWPMIVLRTPKGWTGPKTIDGRQVEGHHRSHQVPFSDARGNPEHLAALQEWLASYAAEELYEADGSPAEAIRSLTPEGNRRMGMQPATNGGSVRRELVLPDLDPFEVDVPHPGQVRAEDTRVLGDWLAAVMKANLDSGLDHFRVFAPDELESNRLGALLEVTDHAWPRSPGEDVPGAGRVMEVLSEHLCQGWLEGYLLTGRHGLFTCYEAFIHIIDSMFNQHAKWLKTTREIDWRIPISSLNYLLTSHVWRQDHNGFSHQDPGFMDHVANKKAEVVRIYLPPDANCLLSVTEHCLAGRDLVNVIVAGKQPSPQYLTLDQARVHCAKGAGIWDWACTGDRSEPDVVIACAGDVPTMEALAAAELLSDVEDLNIRFVNVVDLMSLQSPGHHPHGLSDREFDSFFTRDKPVIFAFHGYPSLVHELTYKRTNHGNFHVHGYQEEGTTTTPFDMTVRNELDRFHLAIDVIDRVPGLRARAAGQRQEFEQMLLMHHDHVRREGVDMPEVSGWEWARG